jgi:hypothetical protein
MRDGDEWCVRAAYMAAAHITYVLVVKIWTCVAKCGKIQFSGVKGELSMYINEVEKKTKINIEASDGEKTLTFDTTVASPKNAADLAVLDEIRKAKPGAKYTVLDPIRREEKLVNFVSDYVISHMVAIIDGHKPFIWRSVSIVNMRLPEYGSVHIVLSNREGVAYNRRQNYRVALDCDGAIRLRTQERESLYNVFVKDVSESGIAFITKDRLGLERGSSCTVEFENSGQSFHIEAVVIRVEESGNGRYTMGCRIRQRPTGLAKFITQKQKEHAKPADA